MKADPLCMDILHSRRNAVGRVVRVRHHSHEFSTTVGVDSSIEVVGNGAVLMEVDFAVESHKEVKEGEEVLGKQGCELQFLGFGQFGVGLGVTGCEVEYVRNED